MDEEGAKQSEDASDGRLLGLRNLTHLTCCAQPRLLCWRTENEPAVRQVQALIAASAMKGHPDASLKQVSLKPRLCVYWSQPTHLIPPPRSFRRQARSRLHLHRFKLWLLERTGRYCLHMKVAAHESCRWSRMATRLVVPHTDPFHRSSGVTGSLTILR